METFALAPCACSDVVVNNAGLAPLLFANTNAGVSVLFTAVAEGCELALKWSTGGLARKASRPVLVLNTASVAGVSPNPLMLMYHSSKAAVIMLTKVRT